MIASLHPRVWPLWDVFYPPVCAVCGRTLSREALLYCGQCWADAPVADLRDLHALKHVDRVAMGFQFSGEGVIRASVHALKYDGMKRLAVPMAKQLLTRLPTRFVEAELVWTVVPLHWRRFLARGFNQSALIARELARLTDREAPTPFLRRIRHTPTQTARSFHARSVNVKGAFAVRPNIHVPKAILLIDDVITTGATVDECARTLKDAGAEWVGALSFALAHPA